MKVTSTWNNDTKKPKTAVSSKKSSHSSSMIYKEIGLQMEKLFNKVKNSQHRASQDQHINITKDPANSILYPDKDKTAHRGKLELVSNPHKNSKVNISNYQNSHFYHNRLENNFIEQPFRNADLQITKPLRNQPPRQLQQHSNTIQLDTLHTVKNDSYFMSKKNSGIRKAQTKQVDKKMFSYQYIIGKGGFGKVWKVEHVKTRNLYAMKQMLKSIVMTKKSVQSVMNERVLLSDLTSPFLVNMHYAFQDRDTLYLVLDLMEGGDLRYHLGNRTFSEVQAKFFIACIILGLDDLHNHQIIHRDIKPQNLVLDARGYIRITDLGIARVYRPNNSSDTSGTPGYMSPEVICRQNHSFVSDLFAVGVIAYELMTGKRPYNGRSRNQIRDGMLAKQVQIRASQIPSDWSQDAADFINRLIQRKPQNRLGFRSIEELKCHPWLRYLNWQKLYQKQIQSPFIPFMKKMHFDQDEQITIEDEEEAELIQKNTLLLRKSQFQQLFKGYIYEQGQDRKTTEKTLPLEKQKKRQDIIQSKQSSTHQSQIQSHGQSIPKKESLESTTRSKINSLAMKKSSSKQSKNHKQYLALTKNMDVARNNAENTKQRRKNSGVGMITGNWKKIDRISKPEQ